MAEKWKNLFEYYGFTEEEARKYPVVSRILKSLTPERIKKENEKIQRVKLPPEIKKWVKEYEKVGDRDEYFWKWLFFANGLVSFPSVSRKYRASLRRTKTLFNMFLALLDDVADKGNLNRKFLRELLKVPFDYDCIKRSFLSKEEKKYIDFTRNIFNFIQRTIKNYPRFKELRDVFEYDVRQLLNAMWYADLVSTVPWIINKTEYWIYFSHNMQAIIDLTMDLMCSTKFDFNKLGVFREISWEAQKMARIGNWITTWEREIDENDFTSGVFAYAVEKHLFKLDYLQPNPDKNLIIRGVKRAGIEKELLKEWESYYKKVISLARENKIFNIRLFATGLEKLLSMHLISKGLK